MRLVEMSFKPRWMENMVVDADEPVKVYPNLADGGLMLVRNLKPDSMGRGVGPVFVRKRDIAECRELPAEERTAL